MLSLISLNDPSDRAVLLSYIHGLSVSYDTEAWKYYIINLRFSTLQQIFRPSIYICVCVCVCVLTFMSRKNSILDLSEPEDVEFFICVFTSEQISSAELSMGFC